MCKKQARDLKPYQATSFTEDMITLDDRSTPEFKVFNETKDQSSKDHVPTKKKRRWNHHPCHRFIFSGSDRIVKRCLLQCIREQ